MRAAWPVLAIVPFAWFAMGDYFPGQQSLGTYTIATLPNAAQNQARYAFVTDLGGGADNVLSDGISWKHIRMGVVTNVAASSSLTVTPLASPPIMQLSGSALNTAGTIKILPANLYAGYTLRVVVPTGALGTLGSLGVNVNGGPSLPLVAGTWEDVQWNGSALIEIAKGTL